MVTIKEIAEELEVSTTTVSNVIHGKQEKCQQKREKRSRKRWYVITMLPITERKKRQKN